MYAFTAIDPDFKPKGSRDPLGFQPLWSESGRKLIKDLSTVSANINDFRILSICKYFYHSLPGKKDEQEFLLFFLRAEQAFAYARRRWNGEISFNGGDFIAKHFKDESYTLSNEQKDTILSNQRTYGIYGKYIRPSRDINLFEQEDFVNVYEKIVSEELHRLMHSIFQKEKLIIQPEALKILADFLKNFTPIERDFYRKTILVGDNPEHNQAKLYAFLMKHHAWSATKNFNLMNWIDGIKKKVNDSSLQHSLENIYQTEKVLAPLSYRFIYLLTRGTWTEKSIQQDEILNQRLQAVSFDFTNDSLTELNKIIPLTGVALVDRLIERNAAISKRRNGNPWIDKKDNKYVVYYGETQRDYTLIKDDYWENPYFIQAYLKIFNDIEQNN